MNELTHGPVLGRGLTADETRPYAMDSPQEFPMMPFSPSEFDWWIWALFAAGFLLICLVCCFLADESKNPVISGFFWLMAFVLVVGFFGCAVIALKQGHIISFASFGFGVAVAILRGPL
jgi:uncharacterized integral membrane protein